MAVLNQIRMLLLASWLGAAILFSAVVAPNAFRVLRAFGLAHGLSNANEIAGTIVTLTLSIINTSGFILGLLLVISAFAVGRSYRQRLFVLEIVMLLILSITTGLGEWVIAAKMRALRAAMRLPIDQVALNDPNRIAFAALHGYSVAALGIAMIAALISFFVVANRVKLN
ncbi:MAG: DUF4149 domain-containing protein [Acidobacteriota bacterium]|nr:DUF4149 domain-containing protein [Acidobacteriota bacterium]